MASFEIANEFTIIVLASSLILLITINYERKFKESLVQVIWKNKKKKQRSAIFDYLKKLQIIASFGYLKNFKEPLGYMKELTKNLQFFYIFQIIENCGYVSKLGTCFFIENRGYET